MAHATQAIPLAEVHGAKWHDLNLNGSWDAEEPGLPGWQIDLSYGDVQMSTVTDDDGSYWFMDLLPGVSAPVEVTVAEVQQPGWVSTWPGTGTHSLMLSPGEVVEGLDFGNFLLPPPSGEIHGTKWHDLNVNGMQDPGEPGLGNWEIVLAFGTNVLTTTTDVDGSYWFTNLPGGFVYEVAEVLQPGWARTWPAGGIYSFALSPDEVVEGVDFGNKFVPEPATLALLGIGLASIGVLRRAA